MCSVVGYSGNGKSCDKVLQGLSRLEYRGYDSSGIACFDIKACKLVGIKAAGQLHNLKELFAQKKIAGNVAIGHTRWATHGPATQENAHPHFDCKKTFAVVHNGIIENHKILKEQLEKKGHVFYSETDTEVIAHLFEEQCGNKKITKKALIAVVNKLQGAFACLVTAQNDPETMIVIRKGSPLCLGIGVQEMFVASDSLAFSDKVSNVIFLPEQTCGLVKKDSYQLFSFDGKELLLSPEKIDTHWVATEKEGHEHYMLKEIYEQKLALTRSVHFWQSMEEHCADTLGITKEELQQIENIIIVGCGTSWHAGRIAEFFFEDIIGIPATAVLASEFRHRKCFSKKNTLCIAISQSGETADTLEAVKYIKEFDVPTIALTNVASSSLVRECDGFLLTQAGPEIAVASTKAFSTQIACLYWFAHSIAYQKKLISYQALVKSERDLITTAALLERCIERYKDEIVHHDAQEYSKFKQSIFLGRHISYPFALEAALKLQEISYIFSQAYPAGELKHGPLALIDDQTPVFLFSHSDPVIYKKLLANAQEVKARNGHLVVFAFEEQKELISLANRCFIIPPIQSALLAPLAMTGLMQFFCYALAKACGRPIDKPRNLAKSVTVE